MNKQDLIAAVADRTGMARGEAGAAVETVFDLITEALSRNETVRVVGFGSFTVTRRKASTGRNPRTGEPMSIAASAQPKFKPGKVLKDSCNR
ncbi:MAG: HU family DNA-binding protein [Alphaproteobacteria bacterium]|nr:HU family DNA-binding protein [Alphaproteobacteria bacterium]